MQATRHIMLDAYDCDLEQSNSFMAVNNLLVNLTNELGMRPVMPPFLLPYYYCDETEDGGISAFIICENGAHVTIHTFPYRHCYFVDILTDGFCTEEEAINIISQQIYARNINTNVVDRRNDNSPSSAINSTLDFGPHYMITVENFDVTADQIFKWLDNIAPKIDMLPISRPYVIYDKMQSPEFISGVLVVAQSHIAFHYSIAERTANIDIFSCSFLDDGIVECILEQSFGEKVKIDLFARGSKYKNTIHYAEQHRHHLRINKAWRDNIN